MDIVQNTNFVDYLLNAVRVCDSMEYFLNFDSKSILKILVFKDLVYTAIFCMPVLKQYKIGKNMIKYLSSPPEEILAFPKFKSDF